MLPSDEAAACGERRSRADHAEWRPGLLAATVRLRCVGEWQEINACLMSNIRNLARPARLIALAVSTRIALWGYLTWRCLTARWGDPDIIPLRRDATAKGGQPVPRIVPAFMISGAT